MSTFGHICGYVGVPKGNPLYGKNYRDNIPELIPLIDKAKNEPIGKRGIIDLFCWDGKKAEMTIAFNVHGGITYTGGGDDYPIKSDLHWIGFDTGHLDDTPEKCNEEYCTQECESLAEQIKGVKQ